MTLKMSLQLRQTHGLGTWGIWRLASDWVHLSVVFFINRSHDPYGHIHCGEAVTLSANFEHEQCQCNLHLSSHSSAVQQAESLHIPL